MNKSLLGVSQNTKSSSIKLGHIAAHVGGGVGAVLKDFIDLSSLFSFENSIFCLDKCDENLHDLTINGLRLESLAYQSSTYCQKLLSECDVILLHYWNHPLLAKFLATVQIPPCRLLVWCHNSGLQEPHIIPTYLSRMARKVIFTSHCSTNAPNLQLLLQRDPEKFGTVHSTHSLESFYEVGRSRTYQNSLSRLLYVGTVSKAKMHTNSAKIFALLSRQGFKICVVGGPDHLSLQRDVVSLGGQIEVIGWTQAVSNFYRNADIFVYPLRNDHYGTGEQVLLEAMAAGLPTVAFNNPAESEIIIHGETGVLVNSIESFVDSVKLISSDHAYYKKMSAKAIDHVTHKFDATIMTKNLINYLQSELYSKKTMPQMPFKSKSKQVNELAFFALNSFFDEELFQSISDKEFEGVELIFSQIKLLLHNPCLASVWTTKTKSTPFHYLSYFPDSYSLQSLSKMIKSECTFESG